MIYAFCSTLPKIVQICLRRVLPGPGQLWRQSCTNRSPERHSLINCKVQPERANSSLRSSDSARFVAASLTLIIRVVMVRLWIDVVITVGFGCYFYIINIIITLLRNEGAAIHRDNKDCHPEALN